MKTQKELDDEMLKNVSGGASLKETIRFINTNMTTVPEKIREKLIVKLTIQGSIPSALKTASCFLSEDYPDIYESLKTFVLQHQSDC